MSSAHQNNPKKLFTLKEVSLILSVPIETLLSWNEHHILKPTITSEGEVGYTAEQIDQFLTIRQIIQAPRAKEMAEDPAEPEDQTGPWNTQILASDIQGSDGINSSASQNTSNYLSRLRLVSTFMLTILVVVITVFAFDGKLRFIIDQFQNYQNSSVNRMSVQTSKFNLSAWIASALPIQLRNDTVSEKNLQAENIPKEKNIALSSVYKQPKAKTSTPRTLTSENRGDVSPFTTFASRTGENDSSSNLLIDDRGNIKGEAKDTLAEALTGIGIAAQGSDLQRQSNQDSRNQLILLVLGVMSFIFLLQSRLSYLFKPAAVQPSAWNLQSVTSGKVMEIDQKTDGTVFLNLRGKEYKISKPELYSESDQFIERLMELAGPGVKEIEYEALSDERSRLTTPLSRLVTRLGFVGIKRELFFPRTSKDRVLFRKYITEQDINDMNLSLDQISEDLIKTP